MLNTKLNPYLTVIKKIISFTSLLFIFISCATPASLHFHSDVKQAYERNQLRDIKLLMETSSQEGNRDLIAASVYYLGLYLRDLSNNKRRIVLKETTQEKVVLLIFEHLKKVYLISSDFNIKNLCLQAISHHNKKETIRFLLEVLKSDKEPNSVTLQALREIRFFIPSQLSDNTLRRNLLPVLESFILQQEDEALFWEAGYSLVLIKKYFRDKKSIEILANYFSTRKSGQDSSKARYYYLLLKKIEKYELN